MSSPNTNFRTQTPKGDGNLCESFSHLLLEIRISEHKPRKGTETSSLSGIISGVIYEFQNTNPERGRKHTSGSWLFAKSQIISEHKPRKGTETARTSKNTSRNVAFQNTNPERGRKPLSTYFKSVISKVFQNTNPERGRKLLRWSYTCNVQSHFRTQTPKGDGNCRV